MLWIRSAKTANARAGCPNATRRAWIAAMLAASLLAPGFAAPQSATPKQAEAPAAKPKDSDVNKKLGGGNLETSLALMTQWAERPEPLLEFYKAAYRVFAADPRASYMDLANDAEAMRLAAECGLRHLGGPLLGCVTAEGATVWLRTLRPAQVEVRLAIDGGETVFGPVHSSAETDLSAVVPISGLAPQTRYPYRVLVDGDEIPLPEGAAIVTAPLPNPPGKVRIAFGSCFHRWGLGNMRQAQAILSRQPAAMLAIGDIAAQDRDNHLGMHRADYLQRDLQPAWQRLAAALPLYAVWDDHDYFNNDKFGVPKGYTGQDRAAVRDVFRHAWNNPSYGFGDEEGGVFLRARIGPCDVIMTDERYFREGVPGSFLGPRQMQWLEEQLLDCQGPFIILSSGTMWSDYVSNGKDSWGVWDPEGRERLFRFIEDNRIGGVLLISGDRHGARGFRIPRPSGFQLYEFEAASLGGRSGPPVQIPDCPEQFYGIADRYAFGEFDIDATKQDPEVEFRLIAEDGEILHQMTLTRSQLTPGQGG